MKKSVPELTQARKELLARWQQFRAGPLAQGLYRGRITVEGSRFLEKYQKALVQAVRELPVPGRSAPLDLEKVYVPIRVAEYTPQRMAFPEPEAPPSDQPPARTLSVEDALRVSPHMVLLGQPGSGKSTTLRGLAFRFIRQEVPADYLRQLTLGRQGQPLERLLPILVALPDLAHSDQNLVAFLAETIAAHFPYPHLFIVEQLQRGECLLLLDDLDKIATVEQRAKIAAEIQHLIEQYPLNYVIVTSRPNGQDFPPNFRRWWALGLDDAGIDGLVTRWYADQPEQAQAMLQAMERNQRLRSLAANPLFLSILLVSHDSNPERPVRCAALYERMLHILLWQEADQFAPALKEQFIQKIALELHTRRMQSLPKGELLDRMKAILSQSGQPTDGPDRLLNELVSNNVLWPGLGDTYGPAHLALQECLVARALFARGEVETIAGHMNDPRYEQILVLLSGLQREASELIGLIRKRSKDPKRGLLLAAHCLAEADRTDGALRAEIKEELFDLFREDAPELWSWAATAIAGLEDQSAEGTLLKALAALDPDLRQDAAWALGRVGKGWAVAPLIGALEDPSPNVRLRVAWALGQIRDERALYPLIRVFNDHDRSVAEEAAQTVANIGEPAVEALIRTLGNPSERVRDMAVWTLGHMGSSPIVPLATALGDETPGVREGVKKALAFIGEQAIEPLAAALGAPRLETRKDVVETLGIIGGEKAAICIIKALEDKENLVCQAAIDTLVRMGYVAVWPLIIALADEKPAKQRAIIATFRGIGQVAVEQLIHALGDGRREIRWGAVLALADLGMNDEKIVGQLRKALKDPRREVRWNAVEALSHMNNDWAVGSLVEALEDEDETIYERAAESLRRRSSQSEIAVKMLVEAFHEEKKTVRIIKVLAMIGDTASKNFLLKLLESDDLKIRDEAASALGKIYGEPERFSYQEWERTVNQLLLKYGFVIPSMLEKIPSELRSFALTRYMERHHGEMDLELDDEDNDKILRFHAFERVKKFQNLWDSAVQFVADGGIELSESFARCASELAQLLAETVGLTVIPAKDSQRWLHAVNSQRIAVFDAKTSIAFRDVKANFQDTLPVVFLQKGQLDKEDLDHICYLCFESRSSGSLGNCNTCLLLSFSPSKGVEQARHLCKPEFRGRYSVNAIVFGKEEIQRIIQAEEPRRVWIYSILREADLTLVSPFITHGAVPERMFFGRHAEITAITRKIADTSVALAGGRTIGKTSMLQHIERLLKERSAQGIYYLSCQHVKDYPTFFTALLREFNGEDTLLDVNNFNPEPENFALVVSSIRSDRCPIFIIDEIDDLLKYDLGEHNEQLFKVFRDLSLVGKCRFIFAGEKILNRQLHASGSPLLNFCGEERCLGYLDDESAKQIIAKPMADMNIELQDQPLMLDTILEVSSGHPRLVQYIGHKLIEKINQEPSRCVTYEHLQDVVESGDYDREYVNTIWGGELPSERKQISGLGPIERIITLVLDKEPVTPDEIRQALLAQDVPHTMIQLEEALRNLELYNIIKLAKAEYSFVPKHFLKARKSRDIRSLINTLKEYLAL